MLDSKTLQIAESMIYAELSNRRNAFDLEIGRVQANAVKSGSLHSSGLAFTMGDVCAKEVESSTKRAWEIVHRTLVSTGVR